MQKKISIITSTLNCASSLIKTANSIRNQKTDEVQWIIADGKSTDETLSVINDNIDIIDCWFSQKDTGIYDAWNKALPYVKGEWVIFLGAGDVLAKESITKSLINLSNLSDQTFLAYGCVSLVNPQGKFIQHYGKVDFSQWKQDRPSLPCHQGVFHRRNLFDTFGGFDSSMRICADAKLMLQAINLYPAAYLDFDIAEMSAGGISTSTSGWLLMAKENLQIRSSLALRPNFFAYLSIFRQYLKFIALFIFGRYIGLVANVYRRITGPKFFVLKNKLIYFLLFLLASTFVALCSANVKFNNFYGFFLLSLLCIISSLRVDTGSDYPTYLSIWDSTPTLFELNFKDLFSSFLEPTFLLSNAFLKLLTNSSIIFFAFYSFTTLIILHISLKNIHIQNMPFAYAIYIGIFLLPYTFNALRQALSMSFFLLAIPAILERRIMSVLLLTFISGSFHSSGFFIGLSYLFLYFFHDIKIKLLPLFFAISFIGTVMAASSLISKLFFMIFPSTILNYTEIFSDKTSFTQILFRFGLCILLIIFTDLGRGFRLHIDALLKIYLFGFFIYLAFYDFNVIATRLNMQFRIIEVVLLPFIAFRLTNAKKFAFICIGLLVSLISLTPIALHDDYDYHFYFTIK